MNGWINFTQALIIITVKGSQFNIEHNGYYNY